MSCEDRWTTIPNANEPDSVSDWHRNDLTEPQRKILLSLYHSQSLSTDGLGCTDDIARMSALFSALTGVPTLPKTICTALVGLRKDGILKPRTPGLRLNNPEVPA